MASKEDEEKRNRLLVLAGAVILVISLWIVGAAYRQRQFVAGIESFEECVAAGYPVAESYPRQCHVPDGHGFTEQIGE